MEQDLKILLDGATKELIIRTGGAPENEPQPKKISITGAITALMAYIRHRKPDTNLCHVEISKENLIAKFYENGKDVRATTVEGTIEINPELTKFAINSTCTHRDRTNLLTFLRTNRYFFPNKTAHAELVTAVTNFNAKVDLALQQSETKQGSKVNNFSKNVTADVPLNAVIEIAIFKGEKPKKISIEICYDVTETGASFWFESVELDEQMKDSINETFDALTAELEAENILTIQQ
jgi:hypothetical protein